MCLMVCGHYDLPTAAARCVTSGQGSVYREKRKTSYLQLCTWSNYYYIFSRILSVKSEPDNLPAALYRKRKKYIILIFCIFSPFSVFAAELNVRVTHSDHRQGISQCLLDPRSMWWNQTMCKWTFALCKKSSCEWDHHNSAGESCRQRAAYICPFSTLWVSTCTQVIPHSMNHLLIITVEKHKHTKI